MTTESKQSVGTADIERAAAEEFDRWAEAGRGESMARGHRDVTGQLLDRWTLDASSSALDVGCGNGWAVRWMLQRGAGQAAGVDISPAMITEAGQRGGGAFQVASGERLPFADGTFTHLLSVESLYYYSDPGAALTEFARVAAPGAQLMVMMELFAENRGSACWVDALDVQAHLLSERRWAELARAAGWGRVRTLRVRSSEPITPEAEFKASRYWPSYQDYLSYRQAGALGLVGERSTNGEG